MKQNLYASVLAPVFKMLISESQKYKSMQYLLFINIFIFLIMTTAGNVGADTVQKFEPVDFIHQSTEKFTRLGF